MVKKRVQSRNYTKRLKIWLDDERPMPKAYNLHIKTATEAICLLKDYKVVSISLDHDLGEESGGFVWSDVFDQYKAVGCGYDVAKYIEQAAYDGTLKKIAWNVHSANPIGVEKMTQALQNADKFWKERKRDAPDSED